MCVHLTQDCTVAASVQEGRIGLGCAHKWACGLTHKSTSQFFGAACGGVPQTFPFHKAVPAARRFSTLPQVMEGDGQKPRGVLPKGCRIWPEVWNLPRQRFSDLLSPPPLFSKRTSTALRSDGGIVSELETCPVFGLHFPNGSGNILFSHSNGSSLMST